jgi:hypothetical protein
MWPEAGLGGGIANWRQTICHSSRIQTNWWAYCWRQLAKKSGLLLTAIENTVYFSVPKIQPHLRVEENERAA